MPLTVEILTPDRPVAASSADSVVVPAEDGELGILPKHAPLLAQLQAGQIRIRRGDSIDFLAVSGGFVEVANDRVAIFAETAEMAQEIDVERARQAAEQARAALRSPVPDTDMAAAEAALRRALARLKTYEAVRQRKRSP